MNEVEKLVTDNQNVGFDVLSYNTGIDKDLLKETHNRLGLGIKRFPNTCFSDYFKPVLKYGFVKRQGGRPVYLCIKDWVYFDRDGKPNVFRKGDTTDLLSVPSFLWGIMDTDEHMAVFAAIPHDQKCKQKFPNKFKTDFEFLSDLLYLGVNRKKSTLAYFGVTLGNFTWFTTTREEARCERIKNEINFWEYVERENLSEVMLNIYNQELNKLK